MSAQTLRSTVCDSTTKEPLIGANIWAKAAKTGTVTNINGKFSLVLKNKSPLIVSYIGYNSKTFAGSLPDTIFLSVNALTEVVVMPDSTLKVLLRKAYNSIEKNYPQKPTYLTCFFRELGENMDSSRFNYLTESVFKIYKPPYTKAGSEHQGQVKVIKSRKVLHPAYINKGVRFYGGPYTAIESDRVLKRAGFINPKHFKNYVYHLEKISSYNNRPIYIIDFESKDSVFNGKIYIDKEDLAYLRFETYRNINKKESFGTRLDATSVSVFDKKDSLWYLKSDKFIGTYKSDREGNIKLTHNYVTTEFSEDSIKAFSYDEQFAPTDVISRYEANTSDDFFKEYNVLEQDKRIKEQINTAFKITTLDSLKSTIPIKPNNEGVINGNSTPKKPNLLISFLLRLNTSFGIKYMPLEAPQANYSATINNIFKNPWSLSHEIVKSPTIALVSSISFRVNKRLYLFYEYTASFKSIFPMIDTKAFGLSYRLVLNKAKKPIFIEPNIRYSYNLHGVYFGKFDNPEKGIAINGKNFNTKSIEASIYQKTTGLLWGVSTNIYSRKTNKLMLHLQYFQSLNTSAPFVRLQEKGAFFRPNRKLDLDIDNSRVVASDTHLLPTFKSNFWVGLTYGRVL